MKNKTHGNRIGKVNRRNDVGGGNLGPRLLKGAGVVAAVYVGLAGFNATKDAYFNMKDSLTLRSNLCSWEDTVAKDDSSYNRWAREAIQESMNLGSEVGITRLEKRLYDANDGRDIVSGEEYKTYTCGV